MTLSTLVKKYKHLAPDLTKLGEFYPAQDDVYKSLEICPKPKVIILGMDPYPTKGNAYGLAFAVKTGMSIPKSLSNIFSELEVDRDNGDLTDWVKQGVLLYNVALTVKVVGDRGISGSHLTDWNPFTSAILKHLNENYSNLVWVLLGRPAQKYKKFIDRKKHKIFMTSHPSPMSANRKLGGNCPCPAFMGSGIFTKINSYLESKEIDPIDWLGDYEEEFDLCGDNSTQMSQNKEPEETFDF